MTAPSGGRSTTRGSGSRSASSSSSASPTCAGRSRSATSTCSSCSRSGSRSTSSTAARSSRRCRSCTRPCSTSSAAWPGSAWKGRGSPSRALWPVWVLLAATVFLAGFRFGLNVRASNVIDVGLRGRHRRAADRRGRRVALRQHADRRGEGVRPGRRGRVRPRADPDERPLRGRPTAAATRTGRSATSPTSPAS